MPVKFRVRYDLGQIGKRIEDGCALECSQDSFGEASNEQRVFPADCSPSVGRAGVVGLGVIGARECC